MKNLVKGMLLLVVLVSQLGAQNATPALAGGGGKSVDNANCGMIYGKSHVFTICAPNGWILDNSIGNQDGIYAAFYPDGSSWNSAMQSGTVMYINTAAKKGVNATVEQLMATDAEDMKRKAQSVVVKKGEPLKLSELVVPVQLFAPGLFNRYEAVAYVDSPKIISMFVMTSKTEDSFRRDYPAFVQLIQSYNFLGSDVTIQHK